MPPEDGPDASRHTVVVLALDDVIAFDLATPVEVFGRTRLADGAPAYEVLVAGPARQVRAGPLGVTVPHGLDALDDADTIVLPGLDPPEAPVPVEVREALLRAHARGGRLVSICVGAFVLAGTGLLDGRRATTHWRAAHRLAALHPRVTVDPNVLFVDDGSLLTSAGAAAALDLCLHLVGRDHGPAVAADAARAAVSPLARDGGQAQYIDRSGRPEPDQTLAPLLAWVEQHAHEDLTVQDLADQAHLSPRTLNRRFRDEVGSTPMQWLVRTRIRHAQTLLGTTSRPVDHVARQVGFGSANHFRTTFRSVVGTTPAAYRRAFSADRQH